MSNRIANTRNLADDEGEVYVSLDRRSVILDLPEEACVASLLLTRGLAMDGAAAPRFAAAPPRIERRGDRAFQPAAPSFWLRLRRRVTTRAAG